MYNPLAAALIASLVSLILIIGKGIVWLLSGSSAVLASLADSIQDCILSASNYIAIRYAMQPADESHRYGHGKMEGIAALGQSAFILGSCVFILLDAMRNVSNPAATEHPYLAIGVMVAAIVINGALVVYQRVVIRKSTSLAIEADSAHYAGDIMIHGGVIIAILAEIHLGMQWADPAIAVLIALWLTRLAIQIGRKAIDMLMDRELPKTERDTIKAIIEQTSGVHYHHDLRIHRHGQTVMMSFDIEVDPSLTFLKAHDIAKRVEDRLHKAYPESEIMIHVDPAGGDITDSRHMKIETHHVE